MLALSDKDRSSRRDQPLSYTKMQAGTSPGSVANAADELLAPGGEPCAPRLFDGLALLTFAAYIVVSVFFFGRLLIGHTGHFYIGHGSDPSIYMWCLVWWPHAITHRLDPFLPKVVWAPTGTNLTWVTSIPLPSLLAFPITQLWGPVAASNMLFILSPALAAFAAFVLCRYVTRSYWPSLLGGYIFGFSAYMTGHLMGHLPYILVFPVPLAIYLVLRRIAGEVRAPTFVCLLAAALVTQFLCSTEICATMTLFAMLALIVQLFLTGAPTRSRVRSLLPLLGVSYMVGGIVLLPFFYYGFAFGYPHYPFNSAEVFSTDALNFFLPTPAMELGRLPWVRGITAQFSGNPAEDGGYLAPLAIVLIFALARGCLREPGVRVLVVMLACILGLALGPRLHVAGREFFALPGKLLPEIPILRQALPGRFMLYAFLDLAVITSLWLSRSRGILGRSVVATLLIVLTLPNLSARFWVSRVDTPGFFSRGLYRRYLSEGATVVVLPSGPMGNSMLWQAQTHLYFRMAGGYTSYAIPKEFWPWPIAADLFYGKVDSNKAEQFKSFLISHNVYAILVADSEQQKWQPLLSTLGVKPLQVAGIALYRAPLPDPVPRWRAGAPPGSGSADSRLSICASSRSVLALAAGRWVVALAEGFGG